MEAASHLTPPGSMKDLAAHIRQWVVSATERWGKEYLNAILFAENKEPVENYGNNCDVLQRMEFLPLCR